VGEARAKLFLAVILDLYSRFVVGWALSAVNDRHLTMKALEMALRRRCPGAGLLHHSDQGSTYASEDYQKVLTSRGITCSMTIICELKAIAKQTCLSLNEEHEQTKLQHSISHVTHAVEEMFETVHPAAALERKRLEGIRDRVLDCCPKEPPPPVCTPIECPAPAPLPPPPQGNPIE
jgi:hypothetical protein